MAVTEEFQIWSPDESHTVEPDVYLAQMADSIEQGMGGRVQRQEMLVSAGMNVAVGNFQPLPVGESTTVEFEPGTRGHLEGMEFVGGVVTIPVDGLYFLSAGVSVNIPQDEVFTVEVVVNIEPVMRGHGQSVPFESGGAFGYVNVSNVVQCFEGDKVRTTVLPQFADATMRAFVLGSNSMSVSLLKPLRE